MSIRHEEKRHYVHHCWCGFVGKDRRDLAEHLEVVNRSTTNTKENK